MATKYKHYEIKLSHNYVLMGYVLAQSAAHARTIFANVTGLYEVQSDKVTILETDYPVSADTIFPADMTNSRPVTTWTRDQSGEKLSVEEVMEKGRKALETLNAKEAKVEGVTSKGVANDLISARGYVANLPILNSGTADRNEAIRVLDLLIEVAKAHPTLFLPNERDIPATLHDLQDVRNWVFNVSMEGKSASSIAKKTHMLGLIDRVNLSIRRGRDELRKTPTDDSTDNIERIIREATYVAPHATVGGTEKAATQIGTLIDLAVEAAVQKVEDENRDIRANEREACAVTAWNVAMGNGTAVTAHDAALEVADRIRGRGEAYPKQDVVMFPRKAAERVAKVLNRITPGAHMNAAEELNSREFIKTVFPKVTRTFHVEATGSPDELDRTLQNIRAVTGDSTISVNISEDTK